MNRRSLLPQLAAALSVVFAFAWSGSGAQAADKLTAVASFSILGDMLRPVGGDRVEVITRVGPNGDAHVYQPTPTDAKRLSEAKVLVINGFGFEGWISRLEQSSGFKGLVVTPSKARVEQWKRLPADVGIVFVELFGARMILGAEM